MTGQNSQLDLFEGLGKNSQMVLDSDSGGERAAAIYSLLGSAKRNDLDPEIYLQHVLERIADHPSRDWTGPRGGKLIKRAD